MGVTGFWRVDWWCEIFGYARRARLALGACGGVSPAVSPLDACRVAYSFVISETAINTIYTISSINSISMIGG